MTEDQAKTKWCPFARVCVGVGSDDGAPIAVGAGSVSYNRIQVSGPGDALSTGEPMGSRCLGSACMAWRWSPVPSRYEPRAQQVPNGYKSWQEPVFTGDVSTTDGFCGLAGQP